MKELKLIVAACSLLLSGSIYAGLSLGNTVTIQEDFGAINAAGDMYATRTSDNDVEFIGCQIRADSASIGGSMVGTCNAKDAAGTRASCETSEANLIEAISSITPYSWVRFFIDPGTLVTDPDSDEYSGGCARITVSNRSFYIPYTPVEKEKAGK